MKSPAIVILEAQLTSLEALRENQVVNDTITIEESLLLADSVWFMKDLIESLKSRGA